MVPMGDEFWRGNLCGGGDLLFKCPWELSLGMSTLEIFRKKIFFFKIFIFLKFFDFEFGNEEKYFYRSIVLLSHGQRPKNLYLRNFSKTNIFFQNIYFFEILWNRFRKWRKIFLLFYCSIVSWATPKKSLP